MDKQIKQIEFVFENCESVVIPYECFTSFKYEISQDKNDTISYFDATIKDNGQLDYGCGFDSYQTPIQRIKEYNDITNIYIKYTDSSEEHFYVIWSNDMQNNKNQTSKLIDFRTIHIMIKKYIPKYWLYQIFNLKEDIQFKGLTDNKIYKIKDDKLSISEITSEIINQKYIIINNIKSIDL